MDENPENELQIQVGKLTTIKIGGILVGGLKKIKYKETKQGKHLSLIFATEPIFKGDIIVDNEDLVWKGVLNKLEALGIRVYVTYQTSKDKENENG